MPERVAIIGTRTPDPVQSATAYTLAAMLTASYQIIVRTGAASGIDEQAMKGALVEQLEVVLPWSKFNRHLIPAGAGIVVARESEHPHWFESVKRLHPAPQRLSTCARRLHARNYGIIEGTILCVAFPDERGGGGTAQGIRIARKLGIPLIQANRGSLASGADIVNQVQAFLQGRCDVPLAIDPVRFSVEKYRPCLEALAKED